MFPLHGGMDHSLMLSRMAIGFYLMRYVNSMTKLDTGKDCVVHYTDRL